ncbi:diaminopimelate epimerase [Neomoorella thermoacetica]|uniref:diaminopimelate epimerase n=1 Tax=Neomoorella thermoacetica TaxID=1525 RepID=UPI0008FAEE8E|nr:diaminopimelate epimerase [Moorella thermoacetica]
MHFVKMHGLGNDFVLVNAMTEKVPGDLPGLARRVCHRRFGIGADGLILVLPSEQARLRMRIFNPDGSEPEMCGNGIRCFARYVYETGLAEGEELQVETLAGIIKPKLILEGGRVAGVRVDMGAPHLEREQIPMAGTGSPVLDEPIEVNGETWGGTCVSMGNPHCVFFVEDVTGAPVTTVGPVVEHHPLFPRRTNVEFIQVLNREELRMRVWERGAGETMACGTGACAAAVAGALTGRSNRKVTVHLAAGDLQIEWSPVDNHVYMTGPAVEVFRGDFPLD